MCNVNNKIAARKHASQSKRCLLHPVDTVFQKEIAVLSFDFD